MLINVLKVFDIVLSVAPGSVQDDANVIALAMWRTSFGGVNDFGLGSAIAVFLFLLVIPMLALNVRRFRREAARWPSPSRAVARARVVEESIGAEDRALRRARPVNLVLVVRRAAVAAPDARRSS